MQIWRNVYKPIHVLHIAASKAPDILARCYGRFIAQYNVNVFVFFFHLAFDLEIFSGIRLVLVVLHTYSPPVSEKMILCYM